MYGLWFFYLHNEGCQMLLLFIIINFFLHKMYNLMWNYCTTIKSLLINFLYFSECNSHMVQVEAVPVAEATMMGLPYRQSAQTQIRIYHWGPILQFLVCRYSIVQVQRLAMIETTAWMIMIKVSDLFHLYILSVLEIIFLVDYYQVYIDQFLLKV